MYQFDRETQIQVMDGQPVGARVHPSYNIGHNPNGGYLMAVGAAAIRQLHPAHPDPLSVTVHYLRPGQGGHDCRIEAQLLRTGKSMSNGRATLIQEDKPRIEVMAAFGDLSQAEPAQLRIAPPDMPTPEQCIGRSGEAQGVDLPITGPLDIRLHPEQASPNGGRPEALVSGYIRFRDGRPPDPLSLLLFSDAFPPAIFGLLGMVGWVPTLELTVQVRRRPAPGWIQTQFRTLDLGGGMMVEDGWLWDSQGELVAQSRQLAMLLRKPGA